MSVHERIVSSVSICGVSMCVAVLCFSLSVGWCVRCLAEVCSGGVLMDISITCMSHVLSIPCHIYMSHLCAELTDLPVATTCFLRAARSTSR